MQEKVLGPSHVTSGTAFWSSIGIPHHYVEPWGCFASTLCLDSQLLCCFATSLIPSGLLLTGAPLEEVITAE